MKIDHKIRVMIVDDHLMVRDGLKVFLSVYEDIEVVAEAQDGQEAVILCKEYNPDVILMDIVMPGMDGPTATRIIREKNSNIQVIALTSYLDEGLVKEALAAGMISYIQKDVYADRMAETIREAYRGRGTIDSAAAQALFNSNNQFLEREIGLTDREKEILVLLADGRTNKEIASELTISLGTVRFHVSNIISKLGVSNRTKAVSVAIREGLVRRD